MNIQSNINQIISAAGVLASMNPELRAKSEHRAKLGALQRKAENIVARDEIILEHLRTGTDEEALEAAKISKPLEAEAIQTSEELFTAIPTEEKYQKLAGNIKVAEERESFRTAQEKAKDASRDALTAEQERARKSKEFAEMITSGVYTSFNDPRKKGD